MIVSLIYVISAVWTMRKKGKASRQRGDETLFGFEKTTFLSWFYSLSLIYHIQNSKDKLGVNDRLADGTDSPYAANFLSSLKHWLDDAPGLADIVEKLPSS